VGGLEDLREALALSERLGLAIETALAYLNLAEMVAFLESLSAGRELTQASLDLSVTRGLTHNAMWTRAALLVYRYSVGEWDELLREADALVSWDREHGGTQIELMALTASVPVLAHRGRLDEAARDVAILLPRAREVGDPQAVGPALVMAALVAVQRGDTNDVAAFVEEFVGFADRARVDVVGALPVVARVCLAAGQGELAARLVHVVDGAPGPVARCALQSARAMLRESEKDVDGAAALYRDAAEGWVQWGSVVERAYALLGLGRCAGDEDALREAAAVFERLQAKPLTAVAA
jgi:hypothetical protein